MIRPASAGDFYPSDPAKLSGLLDNLFSKVEAEGSYDAGIVPHAGYPYSGLAAASFFVGLKKATTIVILGNDHYGNAIDISTHPYDYWETPLGRVPVDNDLAESLDLPIVESFKEHSIEVQLPFLQHLWKNFTFLPITVPPASPDRLKDFGEALKKLRVPVVATTDFSHYVSRDVASLKDSIAIETLLSDTPENLEKIVTDQDISMCGLYPTMALMYAFPKKERELLMYYTSGDMTGDNSSVVGYASIGFR